MEEEDEFAQNSKFDGGLHPFKISPLDTVLVLATWRFDDGRLTSTLLEPYRQRILKLIRESTSNSNIQKDNIQLGSQSGGTTADEWTRKQAAFLSPDPVSSSPGQVTLSKEFGSDTPGDSPSGTTYALSLQDDWVLVEEPMYDANVTHTFGVKKQAECRVI